ncbi:MAG TPA: T9SS type A sorting domain-containing protein, partial [bacterium]
NQGAFNVQYSVVQGGHIGVGNIDTDPMFVNPDNSDFRLQPGSPCIDAGDPTSPLDPDGTRADMGALPFYHPSAVNDSEENQIPNSYRLDQNYPNPFNPTTMISYAVAKNSHVKLTVYNTLGQIVAVLVDGLKSQGSYHVTWDAIPLPI